MQPGSSPLTRGKQAASRGCCVAARLIPAHARKTTCMPKHQSALRAHPHSHREIQQFLRHACAMSGSSSLTRGKHLVPLLLQVAYGLIPSHAGKTWVLRVLTSSRRAHPRSHGENFYLPYKMLEYAGSSRLTLGKRCFDRELAPVVRLIPTYGGKTPGTRPRLRSASAHPRTRGKTPRSPHWSSFTLAHPRSHGENGAHGIPYPYKTDSSPLMRGKRRSIFGTCERFGLIPTHTGKTRLSGRRWHRRGAHPRSRGENFASVLMLRSTVGASPLTEGKLLGRDRDCGQLRPTPEHAGKTLWQWPPYCVCPVHPRSRGEKLHLVPGDEAGAGSSPQTGEN